MVPVIGWKEKYDLRDSMLIVFALDFALANGCRRMAGNLKR
jgi:hypothetical protein